MIATKYKRFIGHNGIGRIEHDYYFIDKKPDPNRLLITDRGKQVAELCDMLC